MSLARSCRAVAALALLALGLAPLAARAQDAAPPTSSGAGSSAVKGEMMQWLKDAESKLNELAEATPENKYSWRPSKGVRSTGEVFMHVAAANYGLPMFLGVKPPAGFDFATYEKSLTKKADIQKALKDSFVHMETALQNASDADMEKPAEFFGMKTTFRGGYMLLLSHAHEHLGQSIAYARSNGIVPPWTARADAASAAKTAKSDGK